MKQLYFKPETQVITLLPKDGLLLTGSNQGYTVDPFNPGFSPSSMGSGLSFDDEELLY